MSEGLSIFTCPYACEPDTPDEEFLLHIWNMNPQIEPDTAVFKRDPRKSPTYPLSFKSLKTIQGSGWFDDAAIYAFVKVIQSSGLLPSNALIWDTQFSAVLLRSKKLKR